MDVHNGFHLKSYTYSSPFQISGISVFFGQRTVSVSQCFQISDSLSYHKVLQDGFMKVAIVVTTVIVLLAYLYSWPFVFC